MNVALIIAGGSGQRMQQDIPKQFLHIHDKPVIIYTLEGFQRNPQIDAIEVVCLDGWHEVLWANAAAVQPKNPFATASKICLMSAARRIFLSSMTVYAPW